MEVRRIDNPANWSLLALAAVVVSMLLVLGIALSVITDNPLPLVLGILVSLPPLGATLYTELNRRPIGILIKEDGFLMKMRSSKTRFVVWGDIRDVYLFDENMGTQVDGSWGTRGRYGSVRLKGERIPYSFPSETVREIVRAYSSKIGHAPTAWDGTSR